MSNRSRLLMPIAVTLLGVSIILLSVFSKARDDAIANMLSDFGGNVITERSPTLYVLLAGGALITIFGFYLLVRALKLR